ncbi:hypothetical protein NW768_011275 [Fusarium equiseti]|uniref:SH3 domain-containing protein n=1 Tax=Fusarium equiseti TaxID=61235 RepID=A0ABQ8QXZ2_FUSEQ|nr:hypothetical protein NW768_011275 [Fusarium equiseti]
MYQQIDLDVSDEAESMETLDRSNVIILEGTVLDNNWVIGKQTGSTEHANIYSVTHKYHDDDDDSDITYEARSYNFDSITPQVKSNRARAIRRLSCRTVLSTVWNGLRVVIYRTGAVKKDKKEKSKVLPGDIVIRPGGMLVVESARKSPKQKTTRQQESDRLRQRSRRRRVKQEKKNAISQDEDQQLQDYQEPEGPRTEFTQPVEVDANEFCFFELLYLINGDEKTLQQVPPATRSQVEDYLAAKEKEVEVDGEEALLEFIAIKEREIVFLRRTNNKFQPVLKNWSEYVYHAMIQIVREFGAGRANDDKDLRVLRTRCRILSEGLDALPSLILEAEESVQKLRLKLRDVRQVRETCEMELEKKRLGKHIRNLEKWTKYVTVGSSPYYRIGEDIIAAETRLKMLEFDVDEWMYVSTSFRNLTGSLGDLDGRLA